MSATGVGTAFQPPLSIISETTERSSSAYRDRQQSVILNADYSYANRYLAQIVMNTTGSCMFMKGKRYGVPRLSALAGWCPRRISRDPARLTTSSCALKAGVIGYNPFGALDLYEDEYLKEKGVYFGPASTDFEWIGGSNKVPVLQDHSSASRQQGSYLGKAQGDHGRH